MKRPTVEFVSTKEAETADVIVCLPWTTPPIMADNMRANCGVCGHLVQHRPTAPKQ